MYIKVGYKISTLHNVNSISGTLFFIIIDYVPYIAQFLGRKLLFHFHVYIFLYFVIDPQCVDVLNKTELITNGIVVEMKILR